MVSVNNNTEDDGLTLMGDIIIKYFLWWNDLDILFPPEDNPEGCRTDGIVETAIPSIVEMIVDNLAFNPDTDDNGSTGNIVTYLDEYSDNYINLDNLPDETINKMWRDITQYLGFGRDDDRNRRDVFQLYACACVRNPNWMDLNNLIKTRSTYQIICVSNTGQITDQHNVPIVITSCE